MTKLQTYYTTESSDTILDILPHTANNCHKLSNTSTTRTEGLKTTTLPLPYTTKDYRKLPNSTTCIICTSRGGVFIL